MSSTDERPLSSLAAKDLFNYMEQIKISFTETAQTEIAATVRTEISAAIAPLHASQREILEELESTKLRVSEIADDNANTKAKVSELQDQMILMQHQLTKSSTPTTSLPVSPNPSTTGPLQVPLIHHPSTSADDRHSAAALEVIHNARKILGFSPITPDDISYLKAQNNMNDNTEAMSVAIIEFLNCEMKVPKSFTDQLIMKRIFPPSRHPTDWKTLYVEFEDTSITDLINQYVTNLLPGKSVSIYVPHSLFPGFSGVHDIEHSYRMVISSTKPKSSMGQLTALLVKPRHEQAPWVYVSLSSLPPLNLSAYDGNPSSSPPPGRARLSSKRTRSESSDTEETRVNKQKVDTNSSNPEETNDADTGDEPRNVENPQKTPSKDDPVLPINKDLGAFHPSACLSPSAAQNLNFDFSSKSGIPLMKKSLNC